MTTQKVGILLALISAFGFATEAIFAKLIYAANVDSITLLTYRFLLTALVIWAYFLLTKQAWRIGWRDAVALILLGGLGLTAVTFTIFSSLKYVPASMTIMLLYTYPTMITFLAYFVLHEPLTKRKLLALPLTLGGCVLLLWTPGVAINFWGVFYGLLAAVCNTFYVVASAKVMSRVPPRIAVGYLMLAAAVVYLLIGITQDAMTIDLSGKVILLLSLMVIISTIVANYTFFWAVERIGASRTAIVATIEPLITAFLAFVILHEYLTLVQLLGGLIIVLGVFIQRGEQESAQADLEKTAEEPEHVS